MTTQKIIAKLEAAKAKYAALVSSITLEDQVHGNAAKESEIESAMDLIERLQMTLSVRLEASKITR